MGHGEGSKLGCMRSWSGRVSFGAGEVLGRKLCCMRLGGN